MPLAASIGRAAPCTTAAVSLGLPAIDAGLPWGGLPAKGLHEIAAADAVGAAAAGFAVLLLARFAAAGAPLLWAHRGDGPYGPGLAARGIDLDRLIIVRCRRDDAILWTLEEALRSGAVAAVLGEVDTVPPIAPRRLQLAAEAGGSTALLLRPAGLHPATAALSATTRWLITPAPAAGAPAAGEPQEHRRHCEPAARGRGNPEPHRDASPGPPRRCAPRGDGAAHGLPVADMPGATLLAAGAGGGWRVRLERCRNGGRPAEWLVYGCDETGAFAVAAASGHRPAAAPAAAVA